MSCHVTFSVYHKFKAHCQIPAHHLLFTHSSFRLHTLSSHTLPRRGLSLLQDDKLYLEVADHRVRANVPDGDDADSVRDRHDRHRVHHHDPAGAELGDRGQDDRFGRQLGVSHADEGGDS